MHDDSALDYSLAGAFARLVALGMPFGEAVAAVTINPARVLGEERLALSPSGREPM
jgi:predicted amidohydrolase